MPDRRPPAPRVGSAFAPATPGATAPGLADPVCAPLALAVLVLALAGALPTAAQEPTPPRAMTLVDLIEMPSVGGPELSPDGRHVVYVRSEADWKANGRVGHIWLVRSDGTGGIQLTNGEDGESSPRWSPDGRTVAFLAERGDDEHSQIWLIPIGGGEALRLTSHPTGVGDIQWSPDGRWIWFTARDEESEEDQRKDELEDDVYAFDEDYEQRHLWRVAVPGSGSAGTVAMGGYPSGGAGGDVVEAERVTEGDFSVVDYALSRDGTRIALVRGPTPLLDDLRQRELYVMAAEPGAAMTRLTDNSVPEYSPRLSPDNGTALFLADSNERFESYYNDNLFLVETAGGEPRMLLPEVPHEVNGAVWSADGRSIYILANTGVRRELFRADLRRDRVTPLTEGDHSVGSWSYVPELDRHVMTISSPTDPGEVWTLDGRGRLSQVTREHDGVVDRFRLPAWEVTRWTGEDGVEIEGIVFYPLDYVEGRRYPLVVQTHGGPASSDKLAWEGAGDFLQVLTAMGYVVLKPNYRGSTGYGDDFLRDMVPGYFDQAHLDVMTGVDHLIDRGIVDGDRMAKMGWSAGGHMTNKIITFTDRFRAAASGAGAANWVSMYAQSDVRFYRTPWFGGTPWQEGAPIEMYWEHSPLSDVAHVTTPTIFLVGQEDPRVPMPQSVEMYRALEANGVPTHLYVAPREGHGWRELRHQLFRANVQIDWFERWVRDRDYEWERAPGDEAGG